MTGEWLNLEDGAAPCGADWWFKVKKKGGKVCVHDIERELFEAGMAGEMYCVLIRVPDEFPTDDSGEALVFDPEHAAKVFAEWCRFKLYDRNGKELV